MTVHAMPADPAVTYSNQSPTGWRQSLAQYTDRRVMLILPLGFASGLPLLLTFSTLSAWFATAGVSRATIGAFALVGTPYAFKFLWSPLIDRLPPPIPIGRRRGWGLAIQLVLIAATLGLGSCNPKTDLALMGTLAILVAFLSASQDVVIDAYRVEILTADQQGPGAAMIQTGYRIAMLVSGAGALIVAARFGWFAAYATMAALLSVGMLVFIFGPEPTTPPEAPSRAQGRLDAIRDWLATAVIEPFADFMRRPSWLAIVLFIVGYKLGEAMAGVMAMPLLRDHRRRAGRRRGDDQARRDARAHPVRDSPVGRQFVLRVAGGRRPSP
jgi:PAT family beta-lactamase induction signal transducer AmpG